MDPQVRTSFIPKKPITATPSIRRSSGINILFFLALILFLGSICLGGGAFAYKAYLEKSIASKSNQLDKARAAFEPATIQDLLRLDDRLYYSKQILDAHVAPSSIFSLLADTTLASVVFSSFTYNRTADGKASIALQGSTATFSEVALQSDEFNKVRSFKNVIFADFTVEDDNDVQFAVQADVDPEAILYRGQIEGGSSASSQPTQVPTASTTEPTPPTP